ncbi:permease [Aurantimonas aggregata]|uniref:permease n=1 Tax=Aurantimonas aggregata TaxID=2047720 RepID=UPI001945392C|nr:permease [Aurantimonas aggregata]
MDFMNLLKSIEALLYELVSWLVFYPLTLWRCVRQPLRMMAYARSELADLPDEQFIDALSPPIFLFLTIVIAHLLDLGFGASHVAAGGVFADTRNLLMFRAVAFSLFPLLLAVQAVRQEGLALNRATLRPAFYSHCFIAAPFVLAIDLAMTVGIRDGTTARILGASIFLAGLAWYLAALTQWFVVHRGTSRHRAFGRALLFVLLGAVALLVALILAALSILASDGRGLQ